LDLGLQDPAGNQSDIPSLGFIAYGKHRDVARSFDACFASLAVTATLALKFRSGVNTVGMTNLRQRIFDIVHSAGRVADAAGEPLRRACELIRVCADEIPIAQFAETIAKSAQGQRAVSKDGSISAKEWLRAQKTGLVPTHLELKYTN
jgi:hypothetical protein